MYYDRSGEKVSRARFKETFRRFVRAFLSTLLVRAGPDDRLEFAA